MVDKQYLLNTREMARFVADGFQKATGGDELQQREAAYDHEDRRHL